MRAALYIDLDNMLGYCYSLGYNFIPTLLVKEILEQGHEIVIARSYGSIKSACSHLNNFILEEEIKRRLMAAGVTHTCCTGRKNTADLELSLDAISRKDDYDIIYIVSSDNDFGTLANRLQEEHKKVQYIRMFKVSDDRKNEQYYPELIGIKTASNIDVLSLIYRNTLEQILHAQITDPAILKQIAQKAINNFQSGITIEELANRVEMPMAFRVLKTAFFGRAFLSDEIDRGYLLALKGGEKEIRSAYYRQCEFILKRKLRQEINEDALNKAFRLFGTERYSLEFRRLKND